MKRTLKMVTISTFATDEEWEKYKTALRQVNTIVDFDELEGRGSWQHESKQGPESDSISQYVLEVVR